MSRDGVNRWKILIADTEFADDVSDLQSEYEELELVCATAERDVYALASDRFDGIIVQDAPLDETSLEKLAGADVLVHMGRNYQNVDAEAVRAHGITFASVPRKGPNCVAELALTLILSLSKDLLISHQSVADGAYRLRGLTPEITAQWKMAFHWMHNTRIHEVRHKTIGVIGMGEIGGELARRASVMGMSTLYYKRNPLSDELERRFNAEYRGLDSLLEDSDYVCLAVPHTPATESMIGADELEQMKEDAFLVNVSRGGVVDEQALIEALRENHIAGAGLDVFTYEPLPSESPLCSLDNVILTPHIGGGTGTSRALELGEALDEIVRVLSGERPHINLSQPTA